MGYRIKVGGCPHCGGALEIGRYAPIRGVTCAVCINCGRCLSHPAGHSPAAVEVDVVKPERLAAKVLSRLARGDTPANAALLGQVLSPPADNPIAAAYGQMTLW